MTTDRIHSLFKESIESHTFISAILSGPQKGQEIQRINIRLVLIKGEIQLQCTETRGNQVFHHNTPLSDALRLWHTYCLTFKQIMMYTSEADYQILISKKQHVTILKKSASKTVLPLVHNRKKEYLIEDNQPLPFLIELGVMNKEGKVYPHKMDKFRQINRFLEMIDDVLPALRDIPAIHIVDFGCGKSYLTFALYYYLKIMNSLPITLMGMDLKNDVIEACRQLAYRLDYNGLAFCVGDINQYEAKQSVHMVVSLHACDTATDAALEKAIRWGAEVILCVPCCQHELFSQVQNAALEPLLKHGILKERFASLVTDAARAQILEALGYNVQVLEFIDMEHTPKNLLIRAIRQEKKTSADKGKSWQSYLEFKQTLSILPSLEKRFARELEVISTLKNPEDKELPSNQ